MPIYRYEWIETGDEFEIDMPLEVGDVTGCKKLIPVRLGNIISHQLHALTTNQQTMKTMREMEIRGDFKRTSTKEQNLMKNVWTKDSPKAPKTAVAAQV